MSCYSGGCFLMVFSKKIIILILLLSATFMEILKKLYCIDLNHSICVQIFYNKFSFQIFIFIPKYVTPYFTGLPNLLFFTFAFHMLTYFSIVLESSASNIKLSSKIILPSNQESLQHLRFIR